MKNLNLASGGAVSRAKLFIAASVAVVGLFCVVGLAVAATTASRHQASAQSSPSSSQSSSASIVAQAKALITAGSKGLLHTTVDDTKITKDSQLVPVKGWPGPTSTPKPPANQRVEIVTCAFGTACETIGRGAAKAAALLGWKADVFDGKGTVQGADTAMDTAIADKPNVIMTAGIPESEIGDKLAQAHSQGIKLVGISSAYESGASGHYDAYVSLHEIVHTILEANWAIADSNGHANIVYVWDPGYPILTTALHISERIIKQCKGCHVLEVYNRPITDALNPVAMEKIANSLAQKYGKKLQYIFAPYGIGVAAMISALRHAGRTDVKVLAGNGEPQNLGLVHRGWQAADFGSSAEWTGYAAIDQSIRLLDGTKPLPDYKEGVSIHVFTKKDSPRSGVVNWNKYIDFASRYKKLWGLK